MLRNLIAYQPPKNAPSGLLRTVSDHSLKGLGIATCILALILGLLILDAVVWVIFQAFGGRIVRNAGFSEWTLAHLSRLTNNRLTDWLSRLNAVRYYGLLIGFVSLYAIISVWGFCFVEFSLCMTAELFPGLYKEFDIWKVSGYIYLHILATAYMVALAFAFGLILLRLPGFLVHLLTQQAAIAGCARKFFKKYVAWYHYMYLLEHVKYQIQPQYPNVTQSSRLVCTDADYIHDYLSRKQADHKHNMWINYGFNRYM